MQAEEQAMLGMQVEIVDCVVYATWKRQVLSVDMNDMEVLTKQTRMQSFCTPGPIVH